MQEPRLVLLHLWGRLSLACPTKTILEGPGDLGVLVNRGENAVRFIHLLFDVGWWVHQFLVECLVFFYS
jgi:hypothetical protein